MSADFGLEILDEAASGPGVLYDSGYHDGRDRSPGLLAAFDAHLFDVRDDLSNAECHV
jgi:hypothetical protein